MMFCLSSISNSKAPKTKLSLITSEMQIRQTVLNNSSDIFKTELQSVSELEKSFGAAGIDKNSICGISAAGKIIRKIDSLLMNLDTETMLFNPFISSKHYNNDETIILSNKSFIKSSTMCFKPEFSKVKSTETKDVNRSVLIQEVKPKFETSKYQTEHCTRDTKFAKRRTSSQIIRRGELLNPRLSAKPSKGEFNTKIARIESIQKQARPESTSKHPMIYRPFLNNKKQIAKAVNANLLTGSEHQSERDMISQYLDISSSTQFVLLLNSKLGFSGVYCNDNKGHASKLYGKGDIPLQIDANKVDGCFKYDMSANKFKATPCDVKFVPSKSQNGAYLFAGIDAVTLKA